LSEDEWARFSEAFTYNTNAIEGSMITAKEVENILERDEWPAGKTREDISETYGVAEAIKHIRKVKDHLSVKLMKDLHFMIFKSSKPFAGKIRPKGVEVVVADAHKNVVHRGAPSVWCRECFAILSGGTIRIRGSTRRWCWRQWFTISSRASIRFRMATEVSAGCS
jgi:hypothetical protein